MLIERIKQDRMKAMKDGDALKKNLLSTLVGEASKNEKTPSDQSVISTIKKFIKNAQDLQVAIASKTESTSELNKAFLEIAILETYLPKQISEDVIRAEIRFLKSQNMNLGQIMKTFKDKFEGQYDGALVSKIAKES